MFFHSFTFNISHSLEFIWSKICLLILPISFLAGLMSLVRGWFKKFALWSFKATKQLAVPFTSTLSSIFAFWGYLIPSHFILLSVSLMVFYMFVLQCFVTDNDIPFQADTYFMFYQRKSMFFFYEPTFIKSFCNFIWKSFLTLWNLIFFTKSMRSSLNGINSLSCGEHLLLVKPYIEPLAY